MVNFSGWSAGKRILLQNRPLPKHVVSPATIPLPELMQFTVTNQAGFAWTPPATLRPGDPVLRPGPVVRQRHVTLTEIMDPATGAPVMALINNRPWDTTEIERPTVSSVEQWNIINLTADTHPIHLHLVQFQVLNRQPIDALRYTRAIYGTDMLMTHHVGAGTMPYPSADAYLVGRATGAERFETGWKDTIQAHPGMVTRILVPFGPNAAAGVSFGRQHAAAPFVGQYVWHCHILDHEDNEMMLPYEVVR